MVKYYIIIFLIAYSLTVCSQTVIYPHDESVIVIEGGKSIRNPWAGGFNSSMYSTMDLNNDSVEDLVVFERSSDRIYTFIVLIENSQKIYIHDPRYESMFPSLSRWVLLVDYNMDGKKDIFTHANLGIKVYKNISTSDSMSWQLIADPLYSKYTTYPSNIYINYSDVPSIEDIDNDGDIDILNFDFVNGANIEFHKNVSRDSLGTSDSLFFKDVDDKWGGIIEGTCTYTFGSNSPVPVYRSASTQSSQHVGAAFLALKDMNGDGDKEAFASKETCDAIKELVNIGNSTNASFNSFSGFPPATTSISFIGMPGIYFEDLDFDGVKDIVATPSLISNNSNGVSLNIDFQHSCWFYKNNGTNTIPAYNFIQKDFLQNTMIEVGENASPAFADFDADGDQDMFIANKGLLNGSNFYSTIRLYENIGNDILPEFYLIDSDYLNLSSKKYTSLRIAFADLNGDHALDIFFTSYFTTSTSSTYDIKYILNTNPGGQSFSFSLTNLHVLPLSPGIEDIPCFYDVDNDLQLDVLLARQSGKISYYRNVGSFSSPLFTLVKDTLGGIKVDSLGISTFLSVTVADLEGDGLSDLITADNSGQLKVYKDFQTDLFGVYSAEMLNPDSSGHNYSLGKLLFVSSADLNNDNYPELFVGNNAGGISCLNRPGVILNPNGYVPTGIASPIIKAHLNFTISPNPTRSEFNINSSEDGSFSIIDLLGNKVREEDWVKKDINKNVNIDDLKTGMYQVKFVSFSGKIKILKLIVI